MISQIGGLQLDLTKYIGKGEFQVLYAFVVRNRHFQTDHFENKNDHVLPFSNLTDYNSSMFYS